MLFSMAGFETAIDAAQAWRQVEAHDSSADGLFVYAVRSTGIFCRPGCPSRRPARRNVIFYSTAAQASAAGYRPCKRCRPQTHNREALDREAALVHAACRFLRRHLDRVPTLAEVAGVAGIRAEALQRAFRRILGVSPRQYHAAQRRERLRRKLGSAANVTEAIYEAGYSSPSRVYEGSCKALGMAPVAYRAHGAGQRIRYTTAACALGRVLVAATQRGLCAVAFADTEQELVANLRRDFAKAELIADHASLTRHLTGVLSQMQPHPASRSLPLDVQATAFQCRVWKALQQIPRGQTRSYGQIAQTLGQPAAVRAVARACSQNPVAVVIPCHRVIAKNGQLTGYRWGIDRKRQLLEMEERQI
jgi:AraC family transcriptional regulator of adaptative response/methylated-DNA-[protein]-cysteine methyltransferase